MNLDEGMFLLIFGGLGLCSLYFWSALRERVWHTAQTKKRDAEYRERLAKQLRSEGLTVSPASTDPSGASELTSIGTAIGGPHATTKRNVTHAKPIPARSNRLVGNSAPADG